MTTPAVPIDYTAKDFSGFRDSMLAYAQTAIPEWTSRAAGDFGVAMVESLAYCLDILSYYQDRLVSEAYLSTATQRASVLDIAQTLGYTPYPAAAASGTVTLVSDVSVTSVTDVPAGTQLITDYQPTIGGPLTYETQQDVTVAAGGGTADVLVVEGVTQGTTTVSLLSGPVPVVDLGTSDGSLNQTFTLPQIPVDQSTVRVFALYPQGAQEWTVVPTLLNAGPTDQVVTPQTDAAGVVSLEFGDGVNGAVPDSGISLQCAYRVGGGSRGNLGANALVDVVSVLPGISVQGSTAMTGGIDAESTDSVRRNAPLAWSIQHRAVTTADYASAALSVPGVEKASSFAQSTAVVTIAILGPSNTAPTQQLTEVTIASVQSRAMAGVSVLVQGGTLVPVNFGTTSSPVVVGVQPQYRRTDVQLAVTQALQQLLDPSVTNFAQRLTIADAYSAVHSLPGVLYVQIPVMARADQGQTGTADIVCRAWEVPVSGTINLTAVGGA